MPTTAGDPGSPSSNNTSNMINTVMPLAGAASAVTNPLFAHLTNVKNRKFTREMYKQQRADALADWNRVNEYNSPRAQMQRFQEAGLNPALIYGQMTDAAPVRASSSSGGQASAPQLKNPVAEYFETRQAKAQNDLTAMQMQLMQSEIDLKKVQAVASIMSTGKTKADTDRILFDLGLKSDLRETTIEGKQLANEKMKVAMQFQLDENDRRNIMLAPTFSKAIEDAANAKLQGMKIKADTDLQRKAIDEIDYKIMLMRKDGVLKDYEIMLNKKGIQKNDPVYLRMARDVLGMLFSGDNTKVTAPQADSWDGAKGATLQHRKR